MKQLHTNLLKDHEKEVAEVINPNGRAPIVLICEHASRYIPQSLAGLGLSKEGMKSHAAWDIGAYDLACKLSKLLDAPLVASRISRLVYDCNRAPEFNNGVSRAMPTKSEIHDIPGNVNLSESDFKARVTQVYEPFHSLISQTIRTSNLSHTRKPTIITIHSFTPVYFGQIRELDLGILHDSDDRLAKPLMKAILDLSEMKAEFNSPYGVSDDVMHTVHKHASEDNLLNVMIEVRNDLLNTSDDIQRIASTLSKAIERAVASC